MARTKKGRAVSGWLIVDKPAGMTSTAVVNKVKWAFSAQKAGHAGTLDPDATGVLAVALGEATKTIPYITDALKCYRFRVVLGAATETMFDMASVGPGCRVLDVAAGAGEQSLAAARRVGPGGHVLATDIAPALLDYARADAQAAGLANVATRELDGEALGALPAASFDVVISRVGLIYFPDQHRALTEACRTLRPGGRVSAVVYSTPDRNGFFSIPVGIIRRVAGLPAPGPGLPGPFSLGAPGVAERVFADAGLVDITVTAVPLTIWSARNEIEKKAWSNPIEAPATRPMSTPYVQWPVLSAPQTEK